MRPLSQNTIRLQNLSRVMSALLGGGPLTRARLAELTGLSLVSISHLVEQLEKGGALRLTDSESAPGAKKLGRRAELVSIDGTADAFLIVDLMEKRFKACVMGFDRTVLRAYTAPAEAEDFSRDLRDFLCRARKALLTDADERSLSGVAVVAPGAYDEETDHINNRRIPFLNALPIGRMVREAFGVPRAVVDEDVKFAARAYAGRPGRGETLFYLYIGEGVGGAILEKGRILRGLNALTGEAGQMVMGGRETYESALSLLAFAEKAAGHSPGDPMTAVERAAREAPERYRAALDQAADTVALLLRSVCWLIDPGEIVINCAYAAFDSARFFQRTEEALSGHLSDAFNRKPVLRAPDLKAPDVYWGAAQALTDEWLEGICQMDRRNGHE